jgi:hypothetical protein
MRKSRTWSVLVASCALLATGVAVPVSKAAVNPVSVAGGVYGVYGLPIIQQDVGAGPLYGAKVKANLKGPLGAEVFYTSYQEGDVAFTAQGRDQTLKGGTQSVFGLNANLGSGGAAGFGMYLTGGIGSYTLTKDNREDITGIGYNGGLGVEFRSTAGLAIDLSGRAHIVPLTDGGSRKFGALQAGINYYFLR